MCTVEQGVHSRSFDRDNLRARNLEREISRVAYLTSRPKG